jgi:hypothetical protein
MVLNKTLLTANQLTFVVFIIAVMLLIYPHRIAVFDWFAIISLLIEFIVLATKERLTFLAPAIRFSL